MITPQKKFNIFLILGFLATSCLIVFLFVFSYFLFLQLKDSIDEARLKTKVYAEKKIKLEKLKKDYEVVRVFLPELETALPPQKEASKLVKDLEILAKQNNLNLISIKATGGKRMSTDMNLTQTVKGKNSYELPLDLSLEGEYSSFVEFVKNLENYKRLNNISGFVVSSASESGGSFVNIKLKVKVFLDR